MDDRSGIVLDCKEVRDENLISESIKTLEEGYIQPKKEQEKGKMFYRLKLKNLETDYPSGFGPGPKVEWSIKQELRRRADEIETEPMYKRVWRYFRENKFSGSDGLLLPPRVLGGFGIYHLVQDPSDTVSMGAIATAIVCEGISLLGHRTGKRNLSEEYRDIASYLKVEIE